MPKKPKFAADALTRAWEAKLREALRERPEAKPRPTLAKVHGIDWFGEG